MFEFKGDLISLEDIQNKAKQKGYNVDTYINFLKTQGLVEKTSGVATQGAPVTSTNDMASSSEDIFLGSQPSITGLQEVDTPKEINIGALEKIKPGEPGYVDDSSLGEKIVLGAYAFSEAFGGISDYANAISTNVEVFGRELFGDELTIGEKKAIQIRNKLMSPSQFFDQTSQYLEQYIDRSDGSITQDIIDGNISSAADKTVDGMVESIPSLVAARLGPWGMLALGVSTAGNKFEEELFSSTEDQNTGLLLLNATVNGGIEAGFEIATRGLLKKAGFISGQTSTKDAAEFLKEGVLSVAKKIGGGFLTEGFSETATELVSTYWDNISLGKEVDPEQLINRLGDTFIIGGAVGKSIASAGAINKLNPVARERAYNTLMSGGDRSALNSIAEQVNNLNEVYETADDVSKPLIDEEMDFLISKANRIKGNNKLMIDNMTKDQFNDYVGIIDQQNKLRRNYLKAKTDGEKERFNKKYKSLDVDAENIRREAEKSIFDMYNSNIKDYADDIGATYERASDVESFQKRYEELSGKKDNVRDVDGVFEGGVMLINDVVAGQKGGAISASSHEFLHNIIGSTFDKLSTKQKRNLNKSFFKILNKDQQAAVRNRLKQDYDISGEGIFETEEMFTAFSDAIDKNEISFNEGLFNKALNMTEEVLRLSGKRGEFQNGRQVYNFLKNYHKTIKKGKRSKRITEFAEQDKIKVGETTATKKSRTSLVESLNDLQQGATTKAEFQKPQIFNEVFKALQPNGAVSNYVKSLKMSPEKTQETIDAVTDRLINFNPQAKRKDGTIIGPRGLGEFIMANVGFGKKVAAKELAVKSEKKTQEVEGDAAVEGGQTFLEKAAETVADKEVEVELTQEQQYSQFRQDLGLNKDMMSKVRNAVIKTFGTKLPEVTSKKFRTALEKAYRTELKKPIQDMIGSRDAYNEFLGKDFKTVYGKLPVETLIQIERNVKPEQRIFTTSRRITKPKEVDELVAKGLLPKDVNRLSGPLLITKLPYPGIKKVMAFYRGENMLEVLGYKVGASTLGTRKDKLAMEIGVELGFDATMETVQMPEVAKKRQDIEDLQGYERIENHNSVLAKQINRDPNTKFSKTLNKAIKDSNISLEEAAVIMETKKMVDIERDHPILYDGLVEEFDETYKPKPYENKRYLDQVSEYAPELAPFIKAKGHQTRKKVKGEYVFDVEGLKNHFNNYSLGVLDYMPQFMGDLEAKAKSNYKFLTNAIFKGNSSRGNGGETLAIRTSRLGRFIRKTQNMGKNITPRTQKLWNDFNKVSGNLELAESTFDGPDTLLRELKKIQAMNISAKKKIKLAQEIFNPKGLDAAQKLFKAYNASIQDWVNAQVDSGKMTREEAMEYVIRDKQKNTNFNKGERALAAFTSIYFTNRAQKVEKSKGEHVKDSATVSAKTTNSIYRNTFLEDADAILSGFEQSYIPKRLADEMDRLGGENSPLKNRRFILNPEIGKNVYDLATGRSMYDLELSKFSLEQSQLLKEAYEKTPLSNAISNTRPAVKYSKSSRGMSTFDFDETLIIDGKNFVTATRGDETVKIPSDKWPIDGPRYAAEGWSFDFSDFVNVRGGKEGPLLQKMKNQIKKYGNKNVFVLTARMQEAAEPIHKWLKSKDINIPIENITGLGKSEGDAKAQWFVEKYAEGYNDMYFVDDALPNVEAVKHVFDQLDIKGKSVQAKVKFSKSMSNEFNKMLERTKGIGAEKIFSRIAAQKRGKNVGRFTFFVPPSADDFAGLLRYFVGKGEQGNRDLDFFNKALIKPFARADRDMKEARQSILDDHKALRKEMPQVVKKLGKMIDDSGFTFDNAIRVYLWDKAGFDIPGLSKRDINFLTNRVKTDQDLKTYADVVGQISKQKEGYVEPSEYWDTESIAADLQNVVNKQGRKKFLEEWKENVDVIFSPENLNKIEATYGSNFREALENILWRMENGTNRAKGMGRIESAWNNWVNNSVGAIMFFNARSAVLQTLSTVNFINFEDNNIFAAAKAFANQKQYWKDFSFLFNSDFLKQRRAGLQTNINEAEIANAVAGTTNKAKAALQYLLKKGFLPTQIADSFAIASGGSTYYRNRIKKYVKQGMSQAEAETQAMEDFMEIAEETQQSARPDRISQQQASSLGRIILAFANTPMQYARLIKKAAGDLRNKRGDWRSNVSRIIYYGAVQSIIFSGLQSAIFALAFDGEEPDEDEIDTKMSRTFHGMLDSLLRGAGLAGAVVSTIKNTVRKFREEDEEPRPEFERVLIEMLQLSPPIGSKSRKVFSALKTYEYNRDVMGEFDTFDLENPLWNVTGNIVSATTNLPLDRAFRKADNIKEALNQDNQMWQRIGLALGWDQWSLGIDPYKDVKEAEKELKKKKKKKKNKKSKAIFLD